MPDNVIRPASYQSILAAIPSLNRSQLETIRTRASFILQNKTASTNQGVQEEDWLLEGIFAVLREKGLHSQIPNNFRIKSNKSFASYQTKSEKVKELIENVLDNEATAVELKGIGIIVARCLADYLRKDLSFNKMMDMIHLVPTAINAAFPGYMQANLLHLILRKNDV